MDIHAMRQERARLTSEARALMDAAQSAGRDMTGDEEQQFDRLMDQADSQDKSIQREEGLREHERRIADLDPRPPEPEGPQEGRGGGGEDAMGAFRSYITGGRTALSPEQARALNMGNDPEGGFLVPPQQFVQELLQEVDDMVDIRRLATVQRISQAESLGVPTLDTDLNDADWTSEVATGAQDDALRLGKRELRPHPLAKRVLVSRTLLRRAALSPETIVRDRLAYKFGVTEEKSFMTGDGSQKPLGLFTASGQGISTSRDRDVSMSAASGALTNTAADDLIDAKYTLKSQYYRRSRWLFHRDVLAGIRKLKDGDGNYIWRPGLASDRPDTILDVPYLVNEFVPNTVANDSYIGMIGDFSFYWIADSLAVEVQRLMELYAETNQVGFIGRQETDGMPVLEEPFVRLQANDTD